MSMGGLCLTYRSPKVDFGDDEWAAVCLDERDHPDPDGLGAWHDRAIAALRTYRPNLANTEPLVFDDGEAPVYFITSGGDILMKNVKGYQWPGGVDDFDLWWGHCVAIASAGPTFCYDLDGFDVVDVTVNDSHEAEGRYRGLM